MTGFSTFSQPFFLEDQEHRLDLIAELVNYLTPSGAILGEHIHGISLFLPSLLQSCQKMVKSDHVKCERAIELLGGLGMLAWSIFQKDDIGGENTFTEYQAMVKTFNIAGQATIKLERIPNFHEDVLRTLFSVCKNENLRVNVRSKAVSAATCWILAQLKQNCIQPEIIEQFFGILLGLLRNDSYTLALNACTSLALFRIHIKKIESYFNENSNFSAHVLNLLVRILGFNINKLLLAHNAGKLLQKDLPTTCTRFFTTLITQILDWILTVPACVLFAETAKTSPRTCNTSYKQVGVTELAHIISSIFSILAKPTINGKIPNCSLQHLSEAAECGFDTELAFDILISEDELVGRGVSGAMHSGFQGAKNL